jgi:hypothetical protein
MKPLRAHDYLRRPEFPPAGPDFRGLRRILVGFLGAVAVCAALCAATVIRDARQHHMPHTEAHARCTCMGLCLRH